MKKVFAILLILISLFFVSVTSAEDSAKWTGVFHVQHFDKEGNVIAEFDAYNNLADEGEYYMFDIGLRGGTAASNFCLRLFNDTPVETDSLATLTGEPSTNGYAGQTIEANSTGWPTLALDSGDYQATSKEVTFSASGGSWGPVTYATLATKPGADCTGTTGKIIAYAALSQSRTLQNGETLKITYKVKLQ